MPISLLIGRLVAEFCGLGWRLGLVVAGFLLAIAGFFTHFMGLSATFEMQNLDSQPLADNPLLGVLAGVLPAEAQLAHFCAFFMSFAIGLALLMIGHALFFLLRGGSEYAAYRAGGDHVSARQLRGFLFFWGGVLLVCAVPLAWLLGWDIEQFRYRALAGVSGLADPTTLAQTIPVREQLSPESLGLSAVDIAYGAGTWGYVAATLLSCLILEIATLDLREHWLRLCALLVPTTEPFADDAVGEPAGTAPVAPAVEPPPAAAADAVQPVIGGRPGEAVSLATARQDRQRYHVDAETRTIWARDYWNTLHDQPQPQPQRKAA